MRLFSAAAVLAAVAMPALAGGTYDSAGVLTGTANNQVHPLGDGHMIIQSANAYDKADMADPANPMARMTGSCFGAIEVKGTMVMGSGNCVLSTDGGDKMAVSWTAEELSPEGALGGQWSVIGGTGAMAGASGGGSFSSLTNYDTGTFANTLTGSITVP